MGANLKHWKKKWLCKPLIYRAISWALQDGLGLEIQTNEIKWAELFTFTRQLNEIMGNNLLLVLSSCVGGGILSCLQPEQHAPYRAIITNTREVFMKDALNGFHFMLFTQNIIISWISQKVLKPLIMQ